MGQGHRATQSDASRACSPVFTGSPTSDTDAMNWSCSVSDVYSTGCSNSTSDASATVLPGAYKSESSCLRPSLRSSFSRHTSQSSSQRACQRSSSSQRACQRSSSCQRACQRSSSCLRACQTSSSSQCIPRAKCPNFGREPCLERMG
ncbi:keratin-associated protein 5-5-like [Melanotaenia boesemani]|uniref:keratin-associated protein 5-5-like n=1 Tax=Melanotaenia boesemani TaxID=1250792 RepID=UPI001C05B9B2|nr:keratin-associated protein 5-5-like [Melanotaenia boesemani]